MAGREDYQQRKEARLERLYNAAKKARNESQAAADKSHNLVKDIPLGQPNIRGALTGVMNKSRNAIEKSINLSDKASYFEDRAKATENNNAISSDDPNCLEKLQEKIDKLTKQKELYKAINAYFKKHGTCKGFENLSEEKAAILDENSKYCTNQGKPFADYQLTSLNQKIKAATDRINKIKVVEAMPNEKIVYDGLCEIESNTETNRVSIKFNEQQPKDIIDLLLRNGYKWSYTEKQWQRLRTPSAWHCTKMLIEQIQKMVNENGINN